MKRDGYINKYTNTRKAATTTEDYIVELQTIKMNKTKDTKPKRLPKQTTKMTTCETIKQPSRKSHVNNVNLI